MQCLTYISQSLKTFLCLSRSFSNPILFQCISVNSVMLHYCDYFYEAFTFLDFLLLRLKQCITLMSTHIKGPNLLIDFSSSYCYSTDYFWQLKPDYMTCNA